MGVLPNGYLIETDVALAPQKSTSRRSLRMNSFNLPQNEMEEDFEADFHNTGGNRETGDQINLIG